jgi:hypothetical protein
MQETYEGGCHCGRVRFRIRADLGELGECNCSICTKKGILHLSVRHEDFVLLSGADALTTYRFNTGVAEHIFCKFCGIHSYGVPRVRPDRITTWAPQRVQRYKRPVGSPSLACPQRRGRTASPVGYCPAYVLSHGVGRGADANLPGCGRRRACLQ